MEKDSAGPKQARVEHLKYIESTRLENERGRVRKYRLRPRLISPRENDCDLK